MNAYIQYELNKIRTSCINNIHRDSFSECNCSCKGYHIDSHDPNFIVCEKQAIAILRICHEKIIEHIIRTLPRGFLFTSHECTSLSNCQCGYIIHKNERICQAVEYWEARHFAEDLVNSQIPSPN